MVVVANIPNTTAAAILWYKLQKNDAITPELNPDRATLIKVEPAITPKIAPPNSKRFLFIINFGFTLIRFNNNNIHNIR